MEQLRLDIQQEVKKNKLEVDKRKRNCEFAHQEVNLASENYHLVSKQYEHGMVTSLDVLNASTDLNSKRIMQVLEKMQCDLAILQLNKSVGDYFLSL